MRTDLVGDHPLPERGLLGWPRATGAGHIDIELRGRQRRRNRLFGHGEERPRGSQRVEGGERESELFQVSRKG